MLMTIAWRFVLAICFMLTCVAAAGTAVSSLINPDLKDDGGSNSHNTVRQARLQSTRHLSPVTFHHPSHVAWQVAYEARLLKRMFLKLQD